MPSGSAMTAAGSTRRNCRTVRTSSSTARASGRRWTAAIRSFLQAIVEDLAVRYPGAKIYKAERERGGYEIKITGGLELIYSADGTFVREDMY